MVLKIKLIILISILTILAVFLVMKKHKDIPEALLENIRWSFSEPISPSASGLIDDVSLYYKNVLHRSFDDNELASKSPLIKLDVKYNYVLEIPGVTPYDDVTWIDKYEIVRIDGNGKYLTYAEILWQLHRKIHVYVKNQNKHYFEGLFLTNRLNEDVPLYELYLGS